MNLDTLAVTLFTIRDHLRTAEDQAVSLKRLRDIGFRSVQVSAVGDTDYGELASMIADAGLSCCATHEKTAMILDEPARAAERLGILGCRYTALPHPGGIDLGSLDAVKAFAARLNEAGRVFRGAGYVLTYHNHSIEFRRVAGKPVLEIIYEETDPELVQAEIDTYWVQHGGGDPVRWCRALTGRLPLLHLKDYVIGADNTPAFAELGAGNLAWTSIIDAARGSGCEWFIVEQDAAWASGDPFESLRCSYEYAKANLCE